MHCRFFERAGWRHGVTRTDAAVMPCQTDSRRSDASLDNTIAAAFAVDGATPGLHNTVDRGACRLRVTAPNDKDDLRRDVEGLELADESRVTIVLRPGPGGVLVNALVSQYQGGVSTLKNGFARASGGWCVRQRRLAELRRVHGLHARWCEHADGHPQTRALGAARAVGEQPVAERGCQRLDIGTMVF
jgi:hypothetical protein